MQELTKKHRTDRAEARFVGTAEHIDKLRVLAKQYDVLDVTDSEDAVYTPEEVLPELMSNRAGVSLRGYRYREGLTQKQLAELTGISQHHISAIENGKCPVGKDRARRLAAALKCDYRRFL